MRVLYTGGGTAGHINPALAAADYLKSKKPNADILFVGNKGSMEERLVPAANYNFRSISISGFQRKITPENIVKNVKTIKRIITASIEAKKIIKEFNPDVCVGTGGYVCGPVLREAAKLGIPCVVHESNAFPGMTIKMLAKNMHTVMLPTADAKKYFDDSVNTLVTGNPVRAEIINAKTDEIKKKLNLDERPVILSVGGSLGAEKINSAIVPLLKRSAKDAKYQHIHSTGFGKISSEIENIKEKSTENITITEYVNMPDCLAVADLIISRAGAITVSEISARGKASILIPSPYVAENHQFHNAMTLVNLGAAEIIEEKDLTSEKLMRKVDSVLSDTAKAKSMGENAMKNYIDDANERIYKITILASKSK